MTTARPASAMLHVPVPWVFILGYLAGVALELTMPWSLERSLPTWTWLAGAGLFVLGAIVAGWAWTLFWRERTTTVPGRPSRRLVTWGPYRLTRNPMYVGLSLAYLGEAGLTRQLWPLLVLPFVLAYVDRVVIPVEEARLSDVFGAAYADYRARVRRWL